MRIPADLTVPSFSATLQRVVAANKTLVPGHATP
ncbi:hypothetical protein FHS78_003159 [Parvibaculum indicum]|nr:hypothetical protein [Parvibaculum indicum]